MKSRYALALGLELAQAILHRGDVAVLDCQVERPVDLRIEVSELGLTLGRLGRGHPLPELIESHLERARRDLFVERVAHRVHHG